MGEGSGFVGEGGVRGGAVAFVGGVGKRATVSVFPSRDGEGRVGSRTQKGLA